MRSISTCYNYKYIKVILRRRYFLKWNISLNVNIWEQELFKVTFVGEGNTQKRGKKKQYSHNTAAQTTSKWTCHVQSTWLIDLILSSPESHAHSNNSQKLLTQALLARCVNEIDRGQRHVIKSTEIFKIFSLKCFLTESAQYGPSNKIDYKAIQHIKCEWTSVLYNTRENKWLANSTERQKELLKI